MYKKKKYINKFSLGKQVDMKTTRLIMKNLSTGSTEELDLKRIYIGYSGVDQVSTAGMIRFRGRKNGSIYRSKIVIYPQYKMRISPNIKYLADSGAIAVLCRKLWVMQAY